MAAKMDGICSNSIRHVQLVIVEVVGDLVA